MSKFHQPSDASIPGPIDPHPTTTKPVDSVILESATGSSPVPPSPTLAEPTPPPPAADAITSESTSQNTPATPADPVHWLRNTVTFLTGQTFSLFGSSVVGYAVIWYITLKTGSGWQYALLFIAQSLAMALTTIPGGVWADRYPRKILMIGADAFVACFTLILAVVMLLGHSQLWLIVIVLCLRGLAGGIQSPAVMATIPQLVPPTKLLRINSINASIQSLIFIAAPALAAVLLVYLPLGWILMVDVITAILGISCVLAVKIPRLARENTSKETGYISHLFVAAKYALAIPTLRRMAIMMVFMMVIVFPPAQMTPVLVVRLFGPEQWKLAAVEIIWSVGMVVGGLILAAWGGLRNRMTLILISSALWGIFTIGLGLAPNIWVLCVVMAVYGLSVPGFQTAALTSVQELIPEHLLGRVMGFVNFIATLAIPLGMAIMGPLADIINIRHLTVILGALGLLVIAAFSLDRGPASKLYAPTVDKPSST